jgi:tetratricopeptide (TPR) repeat protein
MPENTKTSEFLKKLAPCIERGDLDACVEEAARVAREMGVGAGEMLELSGVACKYKRNDFTYVLALTAARGLEGEAKAEAYYNTGVAAAALPKKKKNAEEHYRKAIEANPKLAIAHYNYANLLNRLGRKKEAQDHYQKAIEVNPKYEQAHTNFAIILLELDRKKESEDHFLKAIEANPKFAEAHYDYALMLSKLGRNKEAEDHYQKAIEANPTLIKLNVLKSNFGRILLYTITGIIAIYLAYRLLGSYL